MFNRYRIRGKTALITIPATNGKNPLPEVDVVIDAYNLNIFQYFPGTWLQSIHQNTGKIYIRGKYTANGATTQPIFARLVAEAVLIRDGKHITPKDIVVHIDGDTLNCLESNMALAPIGCKDESEWVRLVEPEPEPEKPKKKSEERVLEEEYDEKGKLLPCRGVALHKQKQRWEVKVAINGKRTAIGYWPKNELHIANMHAIYARKNGMEAYKEWVAQGAPLENKEEKKNGRGKGQNHSS